MDSHLHRIPPLFMADALKNISDDQYGAMQNCLEALVAMCIGHSKKNPLVYERLMIQTPTLQRAPFIRFDRSQGCIDPTNGVYHYPARPVIRSITVHRYRQMEPYALTLQWLRTRDDPKEIDLFQRLVLWASLFQNELQNRDIIFPFACRYYEDPSKESQNVFINPLPEEIHSFKDLFPEVQDAFHPDKCPLFTYGEPRETTMWFVYNQLSCEAKHPNDFYDPYHLLHRVILLAEYLHEAVEAHFKMAQSWKNKNNN